MYEFASDQERGLYVGIYSGAISDDDYRRCVDSMTEFELSLRGQPAGLTAVLVNDPGVEPVPASWRRRMANFNNNAEVQRYLLAIVTPSSVIRGILTAINWLSPTRPGHVRKAHETFDEACAWLEGQLTRPVPQLEELYRNARAKLALPRTG